MQTYYAEITRHVISCDIYYVALCNAVLHQTKKVQAHRPQIDRIEKMAANISTKMATKMATVPQLFSIGRQDRTSKSRHAEPKNKFDSTNAQQSLDYLITVPGPEDEFNAAV